jgi:hypothetical protein
MRGLGYRRRMQLKPPGVDMKAKKAKVKVFTDRQLTRLPDMGYWATVDHGDAHVICVMNGRVKYVRYSRNNDNDWSTLLWSCCPTRKAIAEERDGMKWQHFPDHASMLAARPDILPGARVKAPNDF